MRNILAEAAAHLNATLKAHASQPVTVARGYDVTNEIAATLSRRLLKLDDGAGGVRMEWTDLDVLMDAADYDFGDGPVEPERGDLVYVIEAYDERVFEVAPYSGEPCFRYCDPARTRLRIHCKHVSTEPYA